jgi:hypothetical protein
MNKKRYQQAKTDALERAFVSPYLSPLAIDLVNLQTRSNNPSLPTFSLKP